MRIQDKIKAVSSGRIGKAARWSAALPPLLALVLLTGCEQEAPVNDLTEADMQDVHIKRLVVDPRLSLRKDVATGKNAVLLLSPNQSLTVMSGVVPGAEGAVGGAYGGGHTDAQGRVRGGDSDYIDKADVYWTLNWLRLHLQDRTLPAEFEKALKKAKEGLETTVHDDHYRLGSEAVKHLENGLEHFHSTETLRDNNVNVLMIPWTTGEHAVQRYIDSGGLGFGGKSKNPAASSDPDAPLYRRIPAASPLPLSPMQQKTLDIVQKYGRVYHAAPDTMQKREWDEATKKINRLRDDLGLMNRRENSDGLSPSSMPGLDTDTSGVSGVVPIPEVSDGRLPDDTPPKTP